MNKEVAAYAPVDVAKIEVGDEVKVLGKVPGSIKQGPVHPLNFGNLFYPVKCLYLGNVELGHPAALDVWWTVRLSDVSAARRRVEPKPEACGYTIVLCKCDLPKDHSGQHRTAPPAPPKQEAEPEVKPGTWKHLPSTGYTSDAFAHNCLAWKCQVRRSDGRDHADERRGERRKGAPRKFEIGEKVMRWHREPAEIVRLNSAGEIVECRLSNYGAGGYDHIDRRRSDRRSSK
jgi:hypothetical protein